MTIHWRLPACCGRPPAQKQLVSRLGQPLGRETFVRIAGLTAPGR